MGIGEGRAEAVEGVNMRLVWTFRGRLKNSAAPTSNQA